VVTPLAGRSMNMNAEQEIQFWDHFRRTSLMQRIGEPDDIANLASFLVSDDARNITGSINISDSGFLLNPPHLNFEEIFK